MNKLLLLLLSVPNTIRFNLHYFPLRDALRLPVLVSYKVKLKKLGRKGDFVCPVKTGAVRMGFSDGAYDMGIGKKSTFTQEKGTKIIFDGRGGFCNPFFLTVGGGGQVRFGNHFQANTGFVLSCCKGITFGRDVLIGWNVTVLDGDGHLIYNRQEQTPINLPREVTVGDHVWIGANAAVLKGSTVADGSVVSLGAVVSGVFPEGNQILGGVPARVVKSGVEWNSEWIF